MILAFKREYHDTLTGERVEVLFPDGDACHPFYWMAGNGSCDCNRFTEFMRIKVPNMTEAEDDALDYPCDHTAPRFRVRMFDKAGALIYDDTGDFDKPFVIPH